MTLISKDINKAAELLIQEELVAIPTETVYGMAGNIFSEKAIHRIFEMKKRPLYNPLIVHIHAMEQLKELSSHIPEKAKLLADAFWPGELTLVLPKDDKIPDLITANKPTVALRMPCHPLVQDLLKQIDFPIAAPSANPFGYISPTNAKRVKDYFDGDLKMVLDGGDCTSGIESTIVGFKGEEAILYRLGSISKKQIEAVIGPIEELTKSEKTPDAPGMLLKHYSPRTKTILTEDVSSILDKNTNKRIGVFCLTNDLDSSNIIEIEELSKSSDLNEAAKNLYEAMHRLDHLNLDLIIAKKLPNEGIGKAINDRLERAAAD